MITWIGQRAALLRLLRFAAPWQRVALVVVPILNGVLPNLAAVGAAWMLTVAGESGRDGAGADLGSLVPPLLVVVGASLAMLAAQSLESLAKAEVRQLVMQALMANTVRTGTASVGIAHLEDATWADRLERSVIGVTSAGGAWLGPPAFAPDLMISLAGARVTGLLTAATVGAAAGWRAPAILIGAGLAQRLLVRPANTAMLDVQHAQTHPARRRDYLASEVTRPGPSFREARVFEATAWFVEQFRSASENIVSAWAGSRSRLLLRLLAGDVLVALAVVAVIAEAIWKAGSETSSLAGLVVVALRAHDVPLLVAVAPEEPPVAAATRVLGDVRAVEALGGEPGAYAPTDPPAAPRLRRLPTVCFERVSFRYPTSSQWVLSELDLTLPAGKSTAVVGVNGAGKSTLVKLLAGVYTPDIGCIRLDDERLDAGDLRSWQRALAVVSQDLAAYPLSLAANVDVGAGGQPVDDGLRDRVAARVGLDRLVRELPHGWDTLLVSGAPGGRQLSGGEWQRVALARALLAMESGACVLVLDEPTAAVDVRFEADLFDRFFEITAGATTLVVSHRFSTVRSADQIVVLSEGRVVELGTHVELLRAGGEYARMFAAQASSFRDDRGGEP